MARRCGCGSSATSATSTPSSLPASRRSSGSIASAAARAASGKIAATSGTAGFERPGFERLSAPGPVAHWNKSCLTRHSRNSSYSAFSRAVATLCSASVAAADADGCCCALAALLESDRSEVLLRRLRGGSLVAGSRLSVLVAFDPDRAPNVSVNHALIDDAVSAGAAVWTGAVGDAVATRVACEGLARATLVGLGRDLPPVFLRYQQRSFVVWLTR